MAIPALLLFTVVSLIGAESAIPLEINRKHACM